MTPDVHRGPETSAAPATSAPAPGRGGRRGLAAAVLAASIAGGLVLPAGTSRAAQPAAVVCPATACDTIAADLPAGLGGLALDEAAGYAYTVGSNQLLRVRLGDGSHSKVADLPAVAADGVALDGKGGAYVVGGAERAPLLRVDLATGHVQTVATAGTSATGIALDGAGHAYLADPASATLTQVDLATGATQTLVSGVAALLVAVDRHGGVYAVDTQGNLLAVDPRSQALTTVATGLADATGLTADARDDLLVAGVADVGDVQLVDPASGVETELANTLGDARGVAVDSHGMVYVSAAEPVHGAVWRITGTGG